MPSRPNGRPGPLSECALGALTVFYDFVFFFFHPVEGAMKNVKKSYTICIILTEQREGCKIYPKIWIVHIEQSGRKKEQFRVY